ncbi:MAG TPA: ester cyclase [Gemmatimonadales bacterium]|jgi:steroid delta-isomerase-like uncharacterized protein
MPTHTATGSAQSVIATAKVPFQAFNNKNWDKVKASITADFLYDEVATSRKAKGAEETIALWKGWAEAFPDSKATFHGAQASGNTVVLEVTWKGTHKGPLHTPKGAIPATGKTIDIRACAIVEVAGEKAKEQRHYFDMATLLQQLGLTG